MWSYTARCIGMSIALAGLAACESSSPADKRELGMNDITMLLPMPKDIGAPVLVGIGGDGPGQEFVPHAQFDRIVSSNHFSLEYAELQLVGVRFDSRRRDAIADGSGDGQLRLVFQGMEPGQSGQVFTAERAVHAIYRIPASEVGHVVGRLRALAEIADVPVRAPLQINAAITTVPEYRDRLHTLVTTYARPDQLMVLALFERTPNVGRPGLIWNFVAEDITAGSTADSIFIHGLVPPLDEKPGPLRTATDQFAFQTATPDERMAALAALARIQNPQLVGARDTRCLGCHMATAFEARDFAIAGIDPATVPGRFSTTFDVSIEAGAEARLVTAFRGLGYLGSTAVISQRVANETANVLADIAARFPPAH